MEREERYLVLKIDDISYALSSDECSDLENLVDKVSHVRNVRGKNRLNCVVVEDDWPEYETVWGLIEDRVYRSGKDV